MSDIGLIPPVVGNSLRCVATMSASLIGHSGSSTFRLFTCAVSMSLVGSRFSSESAPGPFHHGIRRRGGTIQKRGRYDLRVDEYTAKQPLPDSTRQRKTRLAFFGPPLSARVRALHIRFASGRAAFWQVKSLAFRVTKFSYRPSTRPAWSRRRLRGPLALWAQHTFRAERSLSVRGAF